MRAVLARPMHDDSRPPLLLPAGTVIDLPEAYFLVRLGIAKAGDAECEQAAGVTDKQWDAAAQAYERCERGIQPEDNAAFDHGWMTGYDADGRWIPGPKYDEYERLHYGGEEEE